MDLDGKWLHTADGDASLEEKLSAAMTYAKHEHP